MSRVENDQVRELRKLLGGDVEVNLIVAEGPTDYLTPRNFGIIEDAARKIASDIETKTVAHVGVQNSVPPAGRALSRDMPNPVTPRHYEDRPWPDMPNLPTQAGAANIQYGQLAQAAAVAPAGRASIKGLEKDLAEADWRKRRPQVMDALDEVFAEVKRSMDKHGGFRSGHEGWAVLQEEVDELWDEIKADNSGGVEARTEAIQIAAMGVKYAVYIASNGR